MNKDNRLSRINDEIKKEIAIIIQNELKDPRLEKSMLVSVTKADATQDLKFCKVYISVLGGVQGSEESKQEAQKEAFEAVKNSGGFIRKLIAERINLRVTPQLSFIFDDSIEHGIRMSKLIDEANRKD